MNVSSVLLECQNNFASHPDAASNLRHLLTLTADYLMQIRATNQSKEDMRTTCALHTYFRVSDIAATSIAGLEGVSYFDNLEDRKEKAGSNEALAIGENVDRLYAHKGMRCPSS